MKVGVGHSEQVDSLDAIQEAIEQCELKLSGLIPEAAILFSAICYDYSIVLNEIQKKYPNIQLIGCTTDGELSSVNSYLEDSLVLTCLASEKINYSTGSATGLSDNLDATVKNAIAEAGKKLIGNPKICIAYFDSLTVSGTKVLDSLSSHLDKSVKIFGGAAGDQWQLKGTYQFHNEKVLNDSITLMFIDGDLNFSTGISTGKEPFGEKFIITKSENNIVYEINDRPATDFYNKYVGEFNLTPSDKSLAILLGDDNGFYLRAPFIFNEDGSILFSAEVKQGSEVKFTRSSLNSIISAVENASNTAINNFKGEKIDVALITSCTGRRTMLGTKVDQEIAIVKSLLPDDVPIGGFYAYGELGPINNNLDSQYHNETFIILLLGEK